VLIHQALAELTLGLPGAAKATLGRVREFGEASPEAAAVHADLGDVTYVERYLAAHAAPTPETLMTYVYLPRLRAALALKRGKPLEAIAALEPARPYEMRDYSVPTLAGEAFVLAGQPDKAANEFRKVTENPGIDPVSVLYPLAHLKLARAYAADGDRDGSRRAYERFFALLKNGGEQTPVVKQARVEYDRLGPAL
jgi:predicted Zn-dependent protease